MNITVLTGNQITEDIFEQMYQLENQFWPEGHYAHLSKEYLQNLFSSSFDGVFAAWDNENNTLAGHFYAIVTSKECIDRYLECEDFTVLENTGFRQGINMMYLYTAILKEEYRGSGCMKKLGIAFCQWLDQKQREGCFVDTVLAEAVTTDGGRTCLSGFLMTPMDDVSEEGVGHYISKGLKEYREKMRKYY